MNFKEINSEPFRSNARARTVTRFQQGAYSTFNRNFTKEQHFKQPCPPSGGINKATFSYSSKHVIVWLSAIQKKYIIYIVF